MDDFNPTPVQRVVLAAAGLLIGALFCAVSVFWSPL